MSDVLQLMRGNADDDDPAAHLGRVELAAQDVREGDERTRRAARRSRSMRRPLGNAPGWPSARSAATTGERLQVLDLVREAADDAVGVREVIAVGGRAPTSAALPPSTFVVPFFATSGCSRHLTREPFLSAFKIDSASAWPSICQRHAELSAARLRCGALGVLDVLGDHLRTGGGQPVDHLRLHAARERPAKAVSLNVVSSNTATTTTSFGVGAEPADREAGVDGRELDPLEEVEAIGHHRKPAHRQPDRDEERSVQPAAAPQEVAAGEH